jgi:hypothetical protein
VDEKLGWVGLKEELKEEEEEEEESRSFGIPSRPPVA